MDFQSEFERQVNNLVELKYPELSNQTTEDFVKQISPLNSALNNENLFEENIEKGTLPFVIVIKNSLVSPNKTMSLVKKAGKEGVVKLFPHNAEDFSTIKEITLPSGNIYLAINIDRGKETINLPPNQALEIIYKHKRSPLTIEEGIAIVTHFPDFLMKNNYFSLLASRNEADKRVPAIWINHNKNPNLGWCWEGNPHTWLGSASCGLRVGRN